MATTTSLMASQTLIAGSSITLRHRRPATLSIHSPPRVLSFFPTPNHFLSCSSPKPYPVASNKSIVFASSSTISANSSTSSLENPNSPRSVLTGSTRTVTTILAVTLAVSKLFAGRLLSFALQFKGVCLNPGLQRTVLSSAGPMFFAAVKDASGSLNTPLTVVAAGMSKWLDIYSGVLMVRVLLSWFPNIPWDRQPLSAIRDLCDPYLNLFRNILPPLWQTIDISPLLAFAVLGAMSSLLSSSRGR